METITENGLDYPLLIALKKSFHDLREAGGLDPEYTFPQVLSQTHIHPTPSTHKRFVHGRSGGETLPSEPILVA